MAKQQARGFIVGSTIWQWDYYLFIYWTRACLEMSTSVMMMMINDIYFFFIMSSCMACGCTGWLCLIISRLYDKKKKTKMWGFSLRLSVFVFSVWLRFGFFSAVILKISAGDCGTFTNMQYQFNLTLGSIVSPKPPCSVFFCFSHHSVQILQTVKYEVACSDVKQKYCSRTFRNLIFQRSSWNNYYPRVR